MDERLIGSFTRAAEQILREIGLEITRVGPANEVDARTESGEAIVVTVGILGDVRGSLLLRLDGHAARNIEAAMYRSLGLEGREPRGMNEAAVGEIANQICGRAVTILSRLSVECEITPPAVIAGTEMTSSLPGTRTFEYRSLEGSFGTLVLFLGMEG